MCGCWFFTQHRSRFSAFSHRIASRCRTQTIRNVLRQYRIHFRAPMEPFHFRMAQNYYSLFSPHRHEFVVVSKFIGGGHLKICCVHMVFLAFSWFRQIIYGVCWCGWADIKCPENIEKHNASSLCHLVTTDTC